jgi:hypothetical protein
MIWPWVAMVSGYEGAILCLALSAGEQNSALVGLFSCVFLHG